MPTASALSGSQYSIKKYSIIDNYSPNKHSLQVMTNGTIADRKTMRDLNTNILKRETNNKFAVTNGNMQRKEE